MSQLWTTAMTAIEASWEDASPESRDRRRQRADNWIDRQPPGGEHDRPGNIDIPGHFGHWNPDRVRNVSFGAEIPNVHWHHLPSREVDLSGPIHFHQQTVNRDVLHDKIKRDYEGRDDDDMDSMFDDMMDRDEHDPPTDEPLIIKHEGVHHVIDGHHGFTKARLLGQKKMWAKVYDTSKPEDSAHGCYECSEHKQYCRDCADDNDD